jgi:hypothetical protein
MEQTTEELWRGRVEACHTSGLSVSEFARRNGYHQTTLSRWKRVLAAKSKPPTTSLALTRVRPGSPSSVAAPGMTVHEDAIEIVARGMTIRVRRGFDAELLRAVLAVVAGA